MTDFVDGTLNADFGSARHAAAFNHGLDNALGAHYSCGVRTVLVIDDDVEILTLLKERLGNKGYNVVTAADGIMACQVVQRQKPDLIIIDFFMPAGDGVVVISRIERLLGDAMPPVMFLTGSGPEAVRKAEESSPRRIVLSKPVNLTILDAHLKQLFDTPESKAKPA